MLPAYFRGPNDVLTLLDDNVDDFLASELSLGKLEMLLQHLWFAGSERVPIPLQEEIMIGRKIVVTERLGLHLVWTRDQKLFIKPLPSFLLDPEFWKSSICCKSGCECSDLQTTEGKDEENKSHSQSSQQTRQHNSDSRSQNTVLAACSRRALKRSARGFLYSYICLISHESDFKVALENHLLPSELSMPSWKKWKQLSREVLSTTNKETVHPRFRRAELRLARLNTLSQLTQTPLFEPYLRHYWDYSSLLRENFTLLATATVFIALVLTAMQVGLATEQLNQSGGFMAASYGFTVFAILFPFSLLGWVALKALWQIVKDLPSLISDRQRILKNLSNGKMPV